jgi:guanosine-3',5'-bis(diphosphate) 3'-pyrophosphohydrolase
MLVAEATDGGDTDLVVAAVLHDAIEDQKIHRELIAGAFGESVAKLVEEVTDDKSLPKEERKRLQVEHAPDKSSRAKLLKLADKTSNLRAIAASPPHDWPVQRRLEYVAWTRRVAGGLVGVSEWLEREFEQAARQAEEAVNAAARRESGAAPDPRRKPPNRQRCEPKSEANLEGETKYH